MARGNRPVRNARLEMRLPDDLKIVLEAIAIAKCSTLSDIVLQILERDAEVVSVAERLYDIGTETPAGKD